MTLLDKFTTLEKMLAAVGQLVEDIKTDALTGNWPTPPQVPIYSQRDARWVGVKLGTGATTIGQEGCLMTDAAQMLTELGHPITPADLNTWLVANGGYVQGNHFVYASVDKFGLTKFRVLGACETIPAPMDMLNKAISDGAYVIAKVDFLPAPGVQQHWVVYRGDDTVTDPWYGDRSPITRYGKDSKTAIMAYAIYDRIGATFAG